MQNYDLIYIALGAGAQSSALYGMSCLGDYGVPRAAYAIFADTQSEIADTYEHLDRLEKWGGHIIPIRRVTRGSLERVSLMEEKAPDRNDPYFISIPAFTKAPGNAQYDPAPGRLRRQCTREFKVEALNREARRLLGYEKGERIAGNAKGCVLIGISLDEVVRVKPSQLAWIDNAYPLIDARLTRDDCLKYIETKMGLPKPVKSACYFCPYHDDEYWAWLKRERPEEFARAVDFDARIRDMKKARVDSAVYLHRSCTPLGTANVEQGAKDLEEKRALAKAQMPLFGDSFSEECEGMCGV